MSMTLYSHSNIILLLNFLKRSVAGHLLTQTPGFHTKQETKISQCQSASITENNAVIVLF